MGCGGHDVGIFHGVVEKTCGDEACGVGHVDHENGSDFIGETAHAGVVPFAAIGACAAYDEARTFATGHFFHLLVVNASGFAVNVVFKSLIYEA